MMYEYVFMDVNMIYVRMYECYVCVCMCMGMMSDMCVIFHIKIDE